MHFSPAAQGLLFSHSFFSVQELRHPGPHRPAFLVSNVLQIQS